MNAYELTFIVRPDLDDDTIDGVIEGVVDRIRTAGGEIVATLPWNPPRRRMAYPIRDYGDGIYITVTFRFDPQRLGEIENTYRLNDRILRFLIVQASDLAVQQAEQRLIQRQTPAPAPVGPSSEAEDGMGAPDVDTQTETVPVATGPTETAAAPVAAGGIESEMETSDAAPEEPAPTAVPEPEPSPVDAAATTEVTE